MGNYNQYFSFLATLSGESVKVDENKLGRGFYLKPIDYKRYKGDSSTYSHLHKDGVKVSDKIFRKGGLGGNFKGDYCELLVYGDDEIGIGGTHCIINLEGKIIYKQKSALNYPYLKGGVVVVENSYYYNLESGEVIVKGSNSIESKEFLFVENRFNDEFEKGVYKIELSSGKIEVFK